MNDNPYQDTLGLYYLFNNAQPTIPYSFYVQSLATGSITSTISASTLLLSPTGKIFI